ncbi:hypothetical protein [Methylotenera sp.]|uniref:hypothetical protein n=1 Tax=Methylotenera sp. TaxID=2051956 RepID=UPI002488D3B2|nr:hypothetical protein [Methylotenera sp.]MDI1298665.1 hypothetical protein [Methylotenera sp.]
MTPTADLGKIKSICVEHFEPDGRHLNVTIAEELTKFNIKSSTAEKCTDNVDAILTYRDKWMWDLTMYMISLSIKLNDPNTGFPLAYGQALHSSLTRQTPQETINEVLTKLKWTPKSGQ